MLKTVGRLKNLRRAPGPQGEVKKIAGPYGVKLYMTEDQRSYFPFPTTMKINWGRTAAVEKVDDWRAPEQPMMMTTSRAESKENR